MSDFNVLGSYTLLFLWPENHRTRSMYNDALVIKLFAFMFTNTYASLFYTAFFREVSSAGKRAARYRKVLLLKLSSKLP